MNLEVGGVKGTSACSPQDLDEQYSELDVSS